MRINSCFDCISQVNRDFVAAVNASLDEPKVFLVYCPFPGVGTAICLPVACLSDTLLEVMAREADVTLRWAFGKIPVCKCD